MLQQKYEMGLILQNINRQHK